MSPATLRNYIEPAKNNGSTEWIIERISSLTFLTSASYILITVLAGFRTGVDLDRFLISVINAAFTLMLVMSTYSLAFVRGKAILDDYVQNPALKLTCALLLLVSSIVMCLFFSLSIIYYHVISSLLIAI